MRLPETNGIPKLRVVYGNTPKKLQAGRRERGRFCSLTIGGRVPIRVGVQRTESRAHGSGP